MVLRMSGSPWLLPTWVFASASGVKLGLFGCYSIPCKLKRLPVGFWTPNRLAAENKSGAKHYMIEL